jgi:glutathione S-transferase
MLKIWGRSNSVNVQKVLWCCEEMAVQYERIDAGGAFTTGDIALGCGIWRWMGLPIERPALPKMERWFATLGQRPAYRKIVMQPLS